MGRLVALVVFVIAAMAIIDVWRTETTMEKRLLWTVVILVLPLIGPLAWFAVSRQIYQALNKRKAR